MMKLHPRIEDGPSVVCCFGDSSLTIHYILLINMADNGIKACSCLSLVDPLEKFPNGATTFSFDI